MRALPRYKEGIEGVLRCKGYARASWVCLGVRVASVPGIRPGLGEMQAQ